MQRYLLGVLVLMLLPSATSVPVFQDDFNSISGWKCYNVERGEGRYTHHDTKGVCEARNGELFLMEESNRKRMLERNLTLPEGDLSLYVSAEGHVDASWSNSKMVVQAEREKDVFWIDNDYSSADVTCSWKGWIDISEFSDKEVRIRFLADGRHTYETENTTSWVRVDELRIVKGSGNRSMEENCSRKPSPADYDHELDRVDRGNFDNFKYEGGLVRDLTDTLRTALWLLL